MDFVLPEPIADARNIIYKRSTALIKITSEDGGAIVTGKIDILVYTPQFWVLVIEAKRVEYSLQVGIPQIRKRLVLLASRL